ncbi:hypothetical protein ACH4F6_38195 [Streptomyces sp. NPDC017936]|uniref:hypothetical protein n=1 Tax=Streptomyces sp. NPDC017936 TaxID=3365016 RepID=UPI003796E08D
MTKEEAAYAATLNLFGSDIVAPQSPTADTLRGLRRAAGLSVGIAYCPSLGCTEPFPHGGPVDGEGFARLWEHLITAHDYSVNAASNAARYAWGLYLYPAFRPGAEVLSDERTAA